jgi:hypothetical protein
LVPARPQLPCLVPQRYGPARSPARSRAIPAQFPRHSRATDVPAQFPPGPWSRALRDLVQRAVFPRVTSDLAFPYCSTLGKWHNDREKTMRARRHPRSGGYVNRLFPGPFSWTQLLKGMLTTEGFPSGRGGATASQQQLCAGAARRHILLYSPVFLRNVTSNMAENHCEVAGDESPGVPWPEAIPCFP